MAIDTRASLSTSADRIRAFIAHRYIQPARAKGLREIEIVAGSVHKEIGLANQMPAVCSVLEGKALRNENGLDLIERSGPLRSSTTAFRFKLLAQPDMVVGLSPPVQIERAKSIQVAPDISVDKAAAPVLPVSALSAGERAYCDAIRTKVNALRSALASHSLPDDLDAGQWLASLTEIKHVLGNFNNDLSFLATLLVKQYLQCRFGISNFDAAAKPQGAAGADVQARTPDGKRIIGEIKTTTPYQPGFGAAQRSMMLKDLARLAASNADYRFMFVVDTDSYKSLCGKKFASKAAGVELVNLVTEQSCVLGTG
jgi:hypothetical protein